VWVVVSITFAVTNLLPGDPARLFAGPQARPADVARIATQLGLDRPWPVRYALFWHRLVHVGPRNASAEDPQHATCASILALGGTRSVHLDFGRSFQLRQPVVRLVAMRFPRTLALGLSGAAVQLLLGVATGTVAALARGKMLDRVLVGATLIGVSAPTFLIALALQFIVSAKLRLLPLDGFGATMGEHLRCLVLPALTLGIYGAAYYTRLTRDEMKTLLGSHWVRTARAKGAPPPRVVGVHALRNALVPLVTAAGLDLGGLIGGAIVTETVFRWPGLGELSVRAMLNRDGPVTIACVVVTSVTIVAINLMVDVAYGWLDPRINAQRAPDNR
jgi:peptide/nickel transport system permease protein